MSDEAGLAERLRIDSAGTHGYPIGEPQDHRHRLRTVRPCDYQDAATLLADFWETVDAVLKERGVTT